MFSQSFKLCDFLINLELLSLNYKFEYTIFTLKFLYMRFKIFIFLLQLLFYLLQFFKISNKFLVNAVFDFNIFEDTFHLLVFMNQSKCILGELLLKLESKYQSLHRVKLCLFIDNILNEHVCLLIGEFVFFILHYKKFKFNLL